jgi:TolB protein
MTHRITLIGFAALGLALLHRTPAADPPAPARITADGGFKQHLRYSPDGKSILLTRIHQGKMALWVMNADGTGPKRLLPDEDAPHFDGCWSPDGKQIVYVHDRLQGTDGKFQINAVDSDGSNVRVVVPHKAFEESPRWSRDGKRLLFVSTRDGNPELYAADADGKNVTRLTSEVAADHQPDWSPDGKSIAFTSGRAGNFEVYVMNADGTGVKRLTDHPAIDAWPVWSPDGKKIAFASNRDGNFEVYVMNADGSGLTNLTRHEAQDNFPEWSPDGKKIAFVSDRDGGSDVYVIDAP